MRSGTSGRNLAFYGGANHESLDQKLETEWHVSSLNVPVFSALKFAATTPGNASQKTLPSDLSWPKMVVKKVDHLTGSNVLLKPLPPGLLR